MVKKWIGARVHSPPSSSPSRQARWGRKVESQWTRLAHHLIHHPDKRDGVSSSTAYIARSVIATLVAATPRPALLAVEICASDEKHAPHSGPVPVDAGLEPMVRTTNSVAPQPALCRWKQGLETKKYACRSSYQTCSHRHRAGWGAITLCVLLVTKPASTGTGPEWGATLVAATLPCG